MMELVEGSTQKTDKAYRALSKESGDYVIDLGDLFGAIETDDYVRSRVKNLFTSPPPSQF